MTLTGALIFLIAMFLIYYYIVFELVDTLLKTPRLNRIYRIPVALLNTLITVAIIMFDGSSSLVAYLMFCLTLFLEFVIFYRDKYACSLFCALACAIHIMSMRSICVAMFALTRGSTIFDIVNTPLLLALSTGVTFMLLDVVIILVIKLVPAKGIRIINQHPEQLGFMISWLSVFGVYLLINSKVYSTPNSHPTLIINQIVAPIAILIGTYIVLFFSIKTGELLGYKEKTEALQHTVEKERRYRTTLDKDVFRAIEVNFTQNELLSGFEDYEDQLGNIVHDYSKMLGFMTQTAVHPEDRCEFTKYFSPLTVIDEFNAGTREISFDYRRLMPNSCYLWMRVLMVMVQDVQSGDVTGFVQIKNIDIEKRQKLELQYKAERDLLTGLYNKGTTETLISKRLHEETAEPISGALFIIDIDNFKSINDRLGHLYGDAVLSELSEGMRRIFRENDVVGRIGGDEFLVFAEGLQGDHIIKEKATAICNAFFRTYSNDCDEGYTVSSSVGIAVFPQDGSDFEVLFKCADAALYAAKAKGKNRYSFYHNDLDISYVSTRTEIDSRGIIQKSFKDNRVEYVFRLLYGSEDTKSAIESVLELIAKTFGFSRANIFEFNENSTHFNGVFEWCAIGISSVIADYTDMPINAFDFVISALARAGGMFMSVPADFPTHAQQHYNAIGIKSIVHFAIKERDNLVGVIAFQDCEGINFHLSPTEFEELRTICQVLSVFMVKQLSSERELRHHKAIEAVMDNMNSIAYVIDRETYEVFYENQNTSNITGHPSVGMKCHLAYRGLDTPCLDCPLPRLSEEEPRCTLELFTKKFQLYTKTSASLLDWSNDRKAMLISSVDITEYK